MTKGRKKKASKDSSTSANIGSEERMARLSAKLGEQLTESARLERAISENLGGLGYGV